MKKLLLAIICLIIGGMAFTQAPQKISYQAVIRNNNGNLVTNQQVSLRISIMKNGGTTGQIDQPIVNRSIVAIYTETHTVTTNANGLATIEIGGGVTSDNFAAIDWSNGTYYLKTSVDLTGRGRYEVMGMSQLISVPYAMYAQKAGSAVYETDPQFNAWDKDYNDLTNRPEIPVVPTNVSAFTNDANYITSADVPAQVNADWNATSGAEQILNKPEIPTVPTNVSSFTNDANYITSADVPAQVNADWNATSGAGQILNKPEIPTVPTNVSAFENDANYLTSYTETDPQFNAWDKDYNDLTNRPEIPIVPTNVSAFENDANYLTSYTETDPTISAWAKAENKPVYDYSEITNTPELFDGNYNNLTNRPEIPTLPTNVSAFENDANYLTSYTETDPTISAWAKAENKPVYDYSEITNTPELFDGNYNNLTNRPEIPTVPTNVSAFENDANYLTSYTETDPQFNAWDKDYNDLTNRPEIPTVPTNVSAFENDANYLTSYTETDPTISAWAKAENKPVYDYSEITNTPELFDGNYNNLTNRPEIPTVPTNVSAFENDANYLTSYTETDPQFNAWDKDYNDLTNRPEIPTVPTNISAFENDANYLTSYTETDPTISAWAKAENKPVYDYSEITNTPELFDGNYNNLTNRPEIPTVPTNVSAFENDANYLTSYTETDPQFNAWDKDYNDLTNRPEIPTVPTNVSAFENDANYLTSYTENDPQFNAWDKDYNDLTNRPEIPVVPTNVSAFENDANYLTSYTETDPQFNAWDKDYNDLTNRPEIPTVPTNVSAFENDANYLTSYTETDPQFNAWDKDYNDLTNRPEIPTVPTNVSAFENDANYLTSYTETDPTISAWAKAENKPVYDYSEITNTPELFDGNYNNLTNTPDLSSYITDETQTLTDVVALSNSAGDRQIKNVADPTENQDAVTKKYVDELIAQFQAEISAFQDEIAALQAEIASLQGTLSATTFTVTFDANGGSGTMNAQAFGSGVEQALTANTFTKEHNNFVGWNTVADGSGTAYTDGQSITITENMTLYAQWTPIIYTITFNANGGSGTMDLQSFTAGVEQTITANAFTRTYYTFIGWNTVADGSGTAYTNGQSITATENMTLYAQWTPITYTVTFDSNGGTGTMNPQTFTAGVAQALKRNSFGHNVDEYCTSVSFTGWNTKANGKGTSYTNQQSIIVTRNMTLYAQWRCASTWDW